MRSSSVICFSISILSTFSEIGLSFPEFMIYNKNQKDNENRADFCQWLQKSVRKLSIQGRTISQQLSQFIHCQQDNRIERCCITRKRSINLQNRKDWMKWLIYRKTMFSFVAIVLFILRSWSMFYLMKLGMQGVFSTIEICFILILVSALIFLCNYC